MPRRDRLYLAGQSALATQGSGWLRTRHEGRFDEDRYLTVTGRLKEIINVGGEKVSTAEIDEVLTQHPPVFRSDTDDPKAEPGRRPSA